MELKKLAALMLLFIPVMSSAQKTLTASGDYTYYAPSNVSLDEAKRIALEQAKTQIIADNFGTVVGVSNSTMVKNDNGASSVSFLSLGESEVKGEWIETLGEPTYQINFEKNMLVVTVSVRGRIREVKASKIQFDSKILRNGTEDKYESSEFKAKDELYMSFLSPVDGYLTVYLYDLSGVSRLLPLPGSKEGSVKIESGKRSVFFKKNNSGFPGYIMTCNLEQEMNRIYVIFSPNQFVRPNDSVAGENLPASLSFEAFQKWLVKCRRQDPDMTVKQTDITIRQK